MSDLLRMHQVTPEHTKKRRFKMLGIDDPQIWLAYILCIVSAIGCIIYGALKWNEGEEDQ